MVHSFRELLTWQLAHELETKVLPLTKLQSVQRDFKFRAQLSDSSQSPCRNIAEGFGRFNPGEFVYFYGVCDASLDECENCLRSGVVSKHFPPETAGPLILLIARCKRAIDKHRTYLNQNRNNPRFNKRRPPKNDR
jgi:four helix bundle protein